MPRGALPGRVSSKMQTSKKKREEVKNENVGSKQRRAMLKRLDSCDLPLSPFAGALLEVTSLDQAAALVGRASADLLQPE